jgi:hypothetical protein
MRSKANENGVSVKTYAGTTGVLLGMNVEPRKWEGLLGFALERLDGSSGEKEWLKAIVPFPGTEREPGELFATNVAPCRGSAGLTTGSTTPTRSTPTPYTQSTAARRSLRSGTARPWP